MSTAEYPALVEALLRPEAYPPEEGLGEVADAVAPVTLVETHISYIFLTGRHAYKVKKPVDYGFLDFTTLEQRRYYCHQEVELNRRIAPEVYLGVVEIRQEGGRYVIGSAEGSPSDGPGPPVEYAVKMRQMPRERAMTVLLRQGRVSEEQVQRLATRIAAFHQRVETSPEITRLGGLEAVRQNVEENFSQSARFVGVCLPPEDFDDLAAYSRAFLSAREGAFQRRAAQGRVRDCHGDLHTAQIFLGVEGLPDGIGIIDCIEFNQRFRYSDVAEDIAFLAMDLDFHQRPDLSRMLIETYVQESGDAGVREFLDFFKSYRAYVRAKVTSFRLDDPHLSEQARGVVQATARDYFRLAHTYTRVFPQPSLVMVAGLTGAGKSTVAQELARRWGLACVSSDVVRKALAGIAADEHRYEAFGRGIYSPEFSRHTYDEMLRQAQEHLRQGRSVVLDATFRRGEERARAVRVARRAGAEAWVVECWLDEAEAQRRLEARLEAGTSASDGRWELYRQQRQEWQPVVETPANRHIRLNTGGVPAENIRQLLYQLYLGAL